MSTTTDITETTGSDRHRTRILDQVAALRTFADFAEEHADEFPDYTIARDFGLHADNRAEMVRLAAALGGQWQKRIVGGFFCLEQDFGGSDEWTRVKCSINTKRENVCERKQVGTETVMKPDPELVAEVPLVAVEEPVFQWVCPESLLDIRPEDFASPVAENETDVPW